MVILPQWLHGECKGSVALYAAEICLFLILLNLFKNEPHGFQKLLNSYNLRIPPLAETPMALLEASCTLQGNLACHCELADLPPIASSPGGHSCEGVFADWKLLSGLATLSNARCVPLSAVGFPVGYGSGLNLLFKRSGAASSGGGYLISEVGWHPSKQYPLLRTEQRYILNIHAVLSKELPGQGTEEKPYGLVGESGAHQSLALTFPNTDTHV